MKTQRRMLVAIICTLAVLASIAGVAAQETQQKVVRGGAQSFTLVTGGGGEAMTIGGQGDNTFTFVSSEMSINGKPVTGAPYSAQAINESIQTLANGNRIVRQSTAFVYRDSEGRTRRDQTISVVGGYSASGGPAQTTFINDPVAGINYILDSKNRTARKIDVSARIAAEKKMVDSMHLKAAVIERAKAQEAKGQEDGGAIVELKQMAEADRMKVEMMARSGAEPRVAGIPGAPEFMMMKKPDPKNTRKESLGKQTIEGVEAEGTRSTTTIPAGEIGNEQPIEIVSENWYSAELHTVVMTRHSDPRMGETTYRLTNINRSEPARSLFEVPSDYTIQESPMAPVMRYKMESEIRKPGAEKKDQ